MTTISPTITDSKAFTKRVGELKSAFTKAGDLLRELTPYAVSQALENNNYNQLDELKTAIEAFSPRLATKWREALQEAVGGAKNLTYRKNGGFGFATDKKEALKAESQKILGKLAVAPYTEGKAKIEKTETEKEEEKKEKALLFSVEKELIALTEKATKLGVSGVTILKLKMLAQVAQEVQEESLDAFLKEGRAAMQQKLNPKKVA
jgi:hypothetical protein